MGPGLLAGLSDDDPAGITTYSIVGADYGYQLLWVLTLSTGALIVFHELGARMGCVTGQGLAGLIRERYGARAGVLAVLACSWRTSARRALSPLASRPPSGWPACRAESACPWPPSPSRCSCSAAASNASSMCSCC